MKQVPRTFKLVMDFDGKKHAAVYSEGRKSVTVTCSYGSKMDDPRGLPAEVFARYLFREILEKAKGDGDL